MAVAAWKQRNVIDADDPHVSRIGLPAPPWLINYADLMTELTILFIVLYAMSAALAQDMQKARADILKTLEEEKIAGTVQMQKDGLRISLEERGKESFFQSGSAELTPYMVEVIDKLHNVLFKMHEKHTVIVEGHTDNIPIHGSKFASNWELSTARATEVVRTLVDRYKFHPEQLAAIGYGEFHPIAPNDGPENRARNRRIVFFVKLDVKPQIKEINGP